MVDSRSPSTTREWLVVCLVLLYCSIDGCVSQSGKKCPPVQNKPSCVCKDHSRGTIDLSNVGLQGSDAPRFSNIQDADLDSMTHSYNPCYPFTKDQCVNAFACDINSQNGEDSFSIADGDSESIYIDTDGTPYLYYSKDTTEVRVYLHCTKKQDLEIKSIGGGSGLDYKFSLSSSQVCFIKPGSIVGVAGLVIIIVFCLAVATYLLVGALVLKFKYGHTGSDVIPQKHFWTETGLLIKDGCVFTFSPIKRLLSSRKDGYESIK